MYSIIASAVFLAFALPSALSLTVPVDSARSLALRDNKFGLKCSNAPSVTAGDYLDPSDVPKTQAMRLPASGSNQPWLGNLWCTPGTHTYTFFSLGKVTPPPLTWRDPAGALHQAVAQVQDYLSSNPDGPISDGFWTTQPAGLNIKIGVRSSKGETTYGILGSALTGLSQFHDEGYNFEKKPLVFQVNDGVWGEVGRGYVGIIDPTDGSCIYAQVGRNKGDCSDVITGKVI